MRIRLTERDLSQIIRRVVNEQTTELKPIQNIGTITTNLLASDFVDLGGVTKNHSNEVMFVDSTNRTWIVSKEWVWQQKGVDDDPRFLDPNGDGSVDPKFSSLFNGRKP